MDSLLSHQVYEQLYVALVESRLRPGDRLNRRTVAEDMGVSVAPVLEAMTQLEWEGFLETSPRLGTVVRTVTIADVLGKFRLRQALEAEAARIYAGERIRAAREALEPLAANADAAPSGSRTNYRTEVAFHTALVDSAGCRELSKAFALVMRHGLYHAAHDLLPAVPPRTRDMHARLLADLCRAEADRADDLIRRHLAPWFAALEASAATAPATPEPVTFRGTAVRLAPAKRRRNPRRRATQSQR